MSSSSTHTIVSIEIGQNGTISPHILRRNTAGRMVKMPGRGYLPTTGVDSAKFTIGVDKGHAGVVVMRPPIWPYDYLKAAIPLGRDRTIDDGQVPRRPGASGNFSLVEEIEFSLEHRTVTWAAANFSSQMRLNKDFPWLYFILQLPRGKRGAITFEGVTFAPESGGAPTRVLKAQ